MSENGVQVRIGRIGLRLKLMAMAIIVSTIPISLVGWVLVDINKSALKESLREHFFTVIEHVSQDVERALTDTQDLLDSCARALVDEELELDQRIALARALVAGDEDVSAVAIYDASGERIDMIREKGSEELQLPAKLDPSLTKAALDRGRAVGRAVATGAGTAVPLVVPIRAEAQLFVMAQAPLARVQRGVEEFADRRLGRRQHLVFVHDESGRAIAHSDQEVADALYSLSEDPLVKGAPLSRTGAEALVFRELDRGEKGEYVTALGAVRELPWGIVVALPSDVAYESFVRMRQWVFAVVIIVIFLATLAATFLAHRITAPIKRLVGFAGELAARRFERRVTINTGDELQVLGNALSRAAMELEESDRKIQEEAAIRSDLGRYLPEHLVERIVQREEDMALGGERREISVLFADVAGFTPLIERHAAEDVVAMLNELFTILTEIVFRHEGTVDKFMGDCVMAFWGAPNPQPDHAERALRAARDMLRFLEVSNVGWKKKFGFEVRLCLGVNSGEAVVGNFGSESRMEYTAIGDVVNVAARLEAVARPDQIVISEATRDAAGNSFEFLSLGAHRLAGKSEDLEVYEVRL